MEGINIRTKKKIAAAKTIKLMRINLESLAATQDSSKKKNSNQVR